MKEKDAYYFPHDCNARNDYKLLRLRAKFGWEGYGIYFAIIEILREQTDYKLGKESAEALSTAIGKPFEWMQDFVNGLIGLELLNKVDGGGLQSESLINRMQHYKDTKEFYREAGRKGAKARWHKGLTPLKPPNSIKVNKIKVNKSINTEGVPFDVFWNDYDKKADRKKSEALWNSLDCETQIKIIHYLPDYIKAQPDKQFRKNPVTFLNNQSWENELVIASNGGKGLEYTYNEMLRMMQKEGLKQNEFEFTGDNKWKKK